jgi:hypothetical protein
MAAISSQMAVALAGTGVPSRLAMRSPTQMVCWARSILLAVRRGWMRERGPHHVRAMAVLSRAAREGRAAEGPRPRFTLDTSGTQLTDPAEVAEAQRRFSEALEEACEN